jgi:hypothetical protein
MRVQIDLPFGGRGLLEGVAFAVIIFPEIREVDAFEVRVQLFEAAQHLIEGMVLHDQDNHVLNA